MPIFETQCFLTTTKGSMNFFNVVHITDYNFIHDLSGPNGAGKTTTMKMIIAEEHPTKGRIKIGPYEIESNDSKGFDYLGYCPQVCMKYRYKKEDF